jgi:lysyl-tRNA synthetase class 2
LTLVTDTPAAPEESLPEQMRIRREKRDRLLAAGTAPYVFDAHRTHTLAQVREQWGHLETGEETQDVVTVAGRVVFIRNTGKLCFATLQEGIGTRLQVMLSLAEVGRGCAGRLEVPGRPRRPRRRRGPVISSRAANCR